MKQTVSAAKVDKCTEIILSIAGSKSEGIITRSEFTNEPGVDLRTKVQVGDELEAKVLKVNDGEGMAALSYKRLAADKGLKRLKEAFENKEVLKEKAAMPSPSFTFRTFASSSSPT